MARTLLIRLVIVVSLGCCGPAVATAQTGETVLYYHTDAIGSVRMITDANMQVVARYDFLPFGEEWAPPALRDPRLFAGKERDPESGFDYFGARYYQNQTARFTRPDDPGFGDPFDPQSMNLYAYARNNPLRYVDPDGHQFKMTIYGERPEDDAWEMARRFFWESLFANRPARSWEPSNSGIVDLARGISRGAGPVVDPRFIAAWYGASAGLGAGVAFAGPTIGTVQILGPLAVPLAPRIVNQANHIFGPASITRHQLYSVLNAFGGNRVQAFRALEAAAQRLANSGAIQGVFETVVQVGGQNVTVRGAVVSGTVRIGTAFVR